MKYIDLTGKRFGRLTTVKCIGKNKWNSLLWLCSCECGKSKIIDGNNLRKGKTKSCGCLSQEVLIKGRLLGTKATITHGRSNSKIYDVWHSMKQRCTNPNHKYYKDYGGRGISVCGRWLKFENFLEDVGEIPKGYEIDRKDNNKGYNKNNHRWATRKQQQRNIRSNDIIIFNGKSQCLSEWAEELKIKQITLWMRLYKYKWSILKAFTTPVKKYRFNKKRKIE